MNTINDTVCTGCPYECPCSRCPSGISHLTFSVIADDGHCVKSGFSSAELAYEYMCDLYNGLDEGTLSIHPSGPDEEVDAWYESNELMMSNLDEEEKAHERLIYLEEAYYEDRKGELIALDGYNPWSIELDDDMPF